MRVSTRNLPVVRSGLRHLSGWLHAKLVSEIGLELSIDRHPIELALIPHSSLSAFNGCDRCQPGTFGEYSEPAVIGGEAVLLAVCIPCPPGKTSLEGSVGEDSCTLAPTHNMGRRAALARVGACDRGLTACLLTEETWEW